MSAHQRMACTLLAAGMLFATARTDAAVLGPGQSMAPGQRLYSSSQLYFATLDPTGDFAVYRTSDGARAWSAGTGGSGAVTASMLRDGRLVLTNAEGRTVWATPTRGKHRVFGVTAYGSAVVLNARRWKPYNKKAEPIVEQMLVRRAKLDWQTPALDSPAKTRQRAAAQAVRDATGTKHPPRNGK
ncbi:hypothetical protein [Luteibacter sp.]|uniref:hypothetical protein n=1 Tax=Luteibacter sp. TaxID=1886636 RepID=UPI003F805F32